MKIQKRHLNVFSEFKKSLERQYKENKQLQKDVKLLQQQSNSIIDSTPVKTATSTIKQTNKVVKMVGHVVGSAVKQTTDTRVFKAGSEAISKSAQAVSDITHKVADPVLNTKTAKTIAKGVKTVKYDISNVTGSSQFAEYQPKEERLERKQELEKRYQKVKVGAHGLPSNSAGVLPDTEATGVQVHSSSKYQKLWSGLKDTTIGKTVHGFSRSLEESDNVLLWAWRSFREKTRSTSESETVQAIKAIRTVEPDFNLDKFFDEAVHFIIPDLLEAHLARDLNVIKNWFSQAQLAVTQTEYERTLKLGLVSHSKLLDYRDFDLKVSMLEEYPILTMTFQCDEIICFKDKQGKVILGGEGNLKNTRYAVAFTKRQLVDPEAEYESETNGWVVMQFAHLTL